VPPSWQPHGRISHTYFLKQNCLFCEKCVIRDCYNRAIRTFCAILSESYSSIPEGRFSKLGLYLHFHRETTPPSHITGLFRCQWK